MGRSYYYFAATLPMIRFGDKLPLPVEEFRLDCRRLLSAGDFKMLDGVLSGELAESGRRNAFVRRWMRLEECFRNEIAWYRSEKYHKNVNVLRGIAVRDGDPGRD
jgi:hypothetical protein